MAEQSAKANVSSVEMPVVVLSLSCAAMMTVLQQYT